MTKQSYVPIVETVPTHTQNAPFVLGIRGRLFIGFGALFVILMLTIISVLIKVSIAESSANTVIRTELPVFNSYIDFNGKIYQSQATLNGWLLTHDPKYKTEFLLTMDNLNNSESTIDNFSKNWPDDIQHKWREAKQLLGQFKQLEMKIVDDPQSVKLIATDLKNLEMRLLDVVDGQANANGVRTGGLFDTQFAVLNHDANQIVANLAMIRTIEYGLLLMGLIASVLITVLTTRSILKYINIFRKHSSRVASGDLRQRIDIVSNDDMGRLGQDLNVMTQSLSTIAKQITDSCLNMVSMLGEVKHSVDIQSSGATEQASSINQITASLGEIEKSSTQTIDKAKMLGEVAERTREKGQLGLDAVEQSIKGMKAVREKVQTIAQTILDLSNQTQQVGEITAVVNTLAQQSKMLALNASIEAAKAGEAGKGFAVVAAEVKNLAEQSEQSTAQVQKILEDIRHATEKAVLATEEGTKGVDLGTGLVEETGEIVRSLSDVIHEATVASQQIEAAIRQEGIGIEQITAGMNEINQVTSSFVESVKQTTEAIDNLSKISEDLKEYIDVYKT